jgi:hypothetical protein
MASDYLRRIEALESAIAPAGRLLIVECRDGEDKEAAIKRACMAQGMQRDGDDVRLIIVE